MISGFAVTQANVCTAIHCIAEEVYDRRSAVQVIIASDYSQQKHTT